jgi:hypothetical protein
VPRLPAIALATLALLVLPAAARAQMQCGGRFVENGATTAQVLELCGEPQQRTRSERTVSAGLLDSPGSDVVTIPVEVWTYEQEGQFTRKLVFESGKLVKTESQGYGDLKPMF